MKDKINKIKAIAENSRYIPTGESTLRAGISAIPFVGGTLDHLLFDKANEIRTRNIEKAIAAISFRLKEISENTLNKKWFDSSEAIEMFKQLIDKIQFEQDSYKSETLAKIYAISGTKNFSDDPNKFAVLQKASELTTIQKKILLIINKVNPVHRAFNGQGLSSTATAIWTDDITNAIKSNPNGVFWSGTLQLNLELEILESLNLIRRTNAPLANILGYEITGLGKLVLKYLITAN